MAKKKYDYFWYKKQNSTHDCHSSSPGVDYFWYINSTCNCHGNSSGVGANICTGQLMTRTDIPLKANICPGCVLANSSLSFDEREFTATSFDSLIGIYPGSGVATVSGNGLYQGLPCQYNAIFIFFDNRISVNIYRNGNPITGFDFHGGAIPLSTIIACSSGTSSSNSIENL